MATARVSIKFDEAAIRAVVVGPSGPGFQLVTRATRLVSNQAKLNARVDTGHLRASVTPSVEPAGLKVIGRVGSPLSYAYAQDQGSRPHVIRPRRAKVLRFVSRRGALVFAARVMHPGVRGNRWLTRALRRAEELGFKVTGTK